MVHAILLVRLARIVARVPRVISTMHNQEQGAQWRYLAFRLTDPLTDVTTTISRLALEETVRRRGVDRKDIILVPNGIRVEAYADRGRRGTTRSALGLGDRFTWLTAGRLTEAKRHEDLLAAVRLVKAVVPDVQVLVAGTGPLHDALEDRVQEWDLAANVRLLGLRLDVPELMQAADAFVMSSAWEGLPMVLLEASASSLPIVATDVGGSRDVIADGETGFLVPPGDPSALAKTMLRSMALSERARREMGERARQRVAILFDIERIGDRWEALYRGT
jgi:glycosyltransferase involved in cell wall biosynthesis